MGNGGRDYGNLQNKVVKRREGEGGRNAQGNPVGVE
jgi:hypothetical protein